jgi:hypothetical protein
MVSLKAAMLILAAWATLSQAAPVDSYEGSSALSPRASYVTKSGLFFNIDGITTYFAGTNSYWIGFLTNNADVDLVVTHLQTSGIKVLRVWGFNDVSSTSSGVWYQPFVSGQAPDQHRSQWPPAPRLRLLKRCSSQYQVGHQLCEQLERLWWNAFV